MPVPAASPPAELVVPPEPPPTMQRAAPLFDEVPTEVRSVLTQAAAEVSLEDKAQLAGMFGKLKELSVESRASVLQNFFPAYTDHEARGLAEIVDKLPMLELWGLVDRLAPAEVQRIKHLNGFNAAGA